MSIVALPSSLTECPKLRKARYLLVHGLRQSMKFTSRVTKVIVQLLNYNECHQRDVCTYRSMTLASNVSAMLLVLGFFSILVSLMKFFLLYGGGIVDINVFSSGELYSFQGSDGDGQGRMMAMLFTETPVVAVSTFAVATITEEFNGFFDSLYFWGELYMDWLPQLNSPFQRAAASKTVVKGTSNVSVQRSNALTFALLVDYVRVDAVLESIDGVLAAFNKVNTGQVLGGTKLYTDLFDVGHLVDKVNLLKSITNGTASVAQYGKVYHGIIDLTDTMLEAYVALYPTSKGNFMFITSAAHSPQYRMRRDTIFLKPSWYVEHQHLLQVMIHGYGVNCLTGIFFLYDDDGTSTTTNAILEQFTYNGFLEPIIIIKKPGMSDELYRSSVVNALKEFRTSCIFIDDTVNATDALLRDLIAGKYGEFNRDRYTIFATSRSLKQGVPSYPSHFGGVYSLQVLPGSTYTPELVDAFEKSFKTFRDNPTYTEAVFPPSGSSMNSLSNKDKSPSSPLPTPAAYFWYFVGALLSNVASRSFNLNSAGAFLETLYDTRTLRIHNFGLGPFTSECASGVISSCLCNIGMKSIYTSYIDPSSLSMKVLNEMSSDLQVLTVTIPSDICLSGKYFQTRRAYVFMFITMDSDHHKSIKERSSTVARIMDLDFDFSNTNKEQNTKYLNHVKEEFLHSSSTEGDIRAIDSQHPFLLFENDHYEVVTKNTLTLTRGSTEWRLKEEPFNPSRLILEPVLADAIHANLAAMKDIVNGSVETYLLAETEEQLELMKASATTLKISVLGSKVIGSTEEWRVKKEMEAAADAVKNEKNEISCVHYASQNVAFALEVASARENLFLFLSTPERAIEVANKTSVTFKAGIPFADNTKVFFATVFGRWWYPSSGIHKIIVKNHLRFGSRVDVFHSEITAVQAALYASVGRFLSDASFNVGYEFDAIDALTANPIIYIPGVAHIGPLSMKKCTDKAEEMLLNRDCSCNKAYRRVTVAEVGDWLTMSPWSYLGDPILRGNESLKDYYTFEYVMDGCGFEYDASHTSRGLDMDTIGVIAGVGALVLLILIGILVFIYCCMGRSHVNAPRDSTKPFAVVFTDIESSTALWSRAPSAMSLSINVHHELIRKQIKLHRGYEVKTIGDSFMIAFKRPEDAVLLSVGVQRSFYAHEWPEDFDLLYRSIAFERAEEGAPLHPIYLDEQNEAYKKLWNGIRVRVGVHYGYGDINKDEVSNGYDYHGTVVNLAARVEGIGHGGQVLITEDVYTSLSETFLINTVEADVMSLNKQSLKGLDDPIHLYQVMPNDLIDRHFNPLRLDVEHTVDDTQIENEDTSSCSHLMLSAKNRSGKASTNETLMSKSIAEKLEIQYRNAFHREDLLKFYHFLKFANVSSTLKFKQDLISHWGKKWNVEIKNTNKTENADDILMCNSLKVLAKITAIYTSSKKSKGPLKDRRRISSASGTGGSLQESFLPPVYVTGDKGRDNRSSLIGIRSPSASENGC